MAKANNLSNKTTSASKQDIYQRLGSFFKNKKLFFVILGTGLFLSIINFNARISEAHDDSLYIEAGYRYVHEFPNYYYTANAPMYPMFLALLTVIFGTNLIVFKLFSMLFFILGAFIYYKALDKKVPDILKYFVLIFLCTNHLVVYYSSQTFSESFYMLVQATFFYFFLDFNWGERALTGDIKLDYKKWLLIGFLMMILTLAKNILVFGIAGIIIFYLLKKEYRKAIFATISFGLFKFLYEIIKSLVWGASAIQYKSQMGILLNKDPYDASKGQEDISGFIGRFTDNIGLYLGKRTYQILGFMDEENAKVSYLLAFIILGLAIYGLYRAVKDKQAVIAFLLFFSGTIAFGTFLVLQSRWDQPRFILVHMPAILLGIFYGIYKFFEKDTINQRFFVVIILVITCSMALSTIKRGFKNIPVVSKNLKGDIYYGYTPDWKNYLQISAWSRDSLPENSLVACRKAPMSFVYAKGKHFYPIYSVIAKDTATQQSNPDSALAIFKRNKVTHILLANIRLNPKQNTGEVINTIHNIMGPIVNKYPEKLTLVKEIGDTEPAYIYKINY
ncbi:MAG: hypothetical protein V4635_11240 [Bacteroidota bacterium]